MVSVISRRLTGMDTFPAMVENEVKIAIGSSTARSMIGTLRSITSVLAGLTIGSGCEPRLAKAEKNPIIRINGRIISTTPASRAAKNILKNCPISFDFFDVIQN